MTQRDTLIDLAKGLGILLVVFAHTYRGELSVIIYLFHMPLFFILTGCALSYSQTTAIKWRRLTASIVVPYVAFSLLTFAYWALVESRFRPVHDSEVIPGLGGLLSFKAQQLVNIFLAIDTEDAFIYNIVLWFLPCMLVGRILYGLSACWTKSWAQTAFIMVCAIFCMTKLSRVPLPWCAEIALITPPMFYIGSKGYVWYREHLTTVTALLSAFAGIALLCLLRHGTGLTVDMLGHAYAGGGIYLSGLAGTTATLGLCRLLEPTGMGRALTFLGRNSLVIMCLHEPLKRILIKVASVVAGMDAELLRQQLLWSVAIVVATTCLLLPCIYVINRYLPWMVGRGKKS